MKLLMIEWVDSHSSRGWQDFETIENSAEALYCQSVGWLAAENKDVVSLVPHIAGERNGNQKLQGCGDLTIPKRAIIKTTVLKK